MKAFNERQEELAKELDAQNWSLGLYIRTAYNDPNKYPERPRLSKNDGLKEMTDDEMSEQLLRMTKRMGGNIK